MTVPSSSYDWMRKINPDLKNLDAIPLTGNVPDFPWEEFSARLSRSFDREGLKIQPGEISWRESDHLYEGLGDSPFPLNFAIPPLRGEVSWVMPSQEIPVLAAILLTKESHPLTLHDDELISSFYRFLALEVLYHFTEVPFDQSLTPILTERATLPKQDSLCLDISLLLKNHTISGRLILSAEFRNSWVEHFAQKYASSPRSEQMAKLAEVAVHLEVGKMQLTLAEWMSVKSGDFLLLDHCSLESDTFNGRVILTINGKQTFRAKIKDNTLKILELPLLHEAETYMAKKHDDDDVSEIDLSEENEDESEDEEEDFFSDADDDLFSAEEDEEETEEEATQTEETELEQEELEEKIPRSQEQKQTQASKKDRPISPEQIPVTLIVEAGQIQMTMEQLMNLEPGNILEINLHPEDGVDLTINGRTVGRGELIRIGEAIGVRILQMGTAPD
jgi:flagellar motor switch protein FliN/FliY